MTATAVGDRVGRQTAKRLLPLVVLAPITFGLLALLGESRGLITSSTGVVVATALSVLVLSAATLWATRRLDEAVRANAEQSRLFLAVTESMGDGVAVADERGHLCYFNPAAESILGVVASDSDASRWAEEYGIFAVDKCTPIAKEEYPLLQALRGQHRDDAELYILNSRNPSGIFVRVSARPVVDEGGRITGSVATFRDVTSEKEARERLEATNAELTASMREVKAAYAELESFTYSVSHDLRAPLRSMTGYPAMILEDFGDQLPEEVKGYLNRIVAASNKMSGLIDGLLVLSRITRKERIPRDVDLTAMVKRALEECRSKDPDRAVTTTVAEDVRVVGDVQLLTLAVSQLIGNAWKFTRPSEHPRIEFGETQRDGRTVHFVRDNGAGFDMAYAEKLFGAFQRFHGEREFEGIGIGLATVQRVIARHGGSIWAEAAPGKGATFYFTLPQNPARAELNSNGRAASVAPRGEE